MRLAIVIVLAACGATPREAKPPVYAALFERGKAWAQDIEVISGHGETGQFVADHTDRGVVRCRVADVRATADARTATVTCSPPYSDLLVTGPWVGTTSGLYHPRVEPSAEELASHAQAEASREAFVYEHTWCVRDADVGEREHREVVLCFDDRGITGGGELVIAGSAWHVATFGKAPPMRNPAREARTFTADDEHAVRGVLLAQQAAWNHGDLDGFMAGYLHDDSLVFTSGGKIRHGWQETYDKYKAKYGAAPATMGHLDFEILGVQPLGADGAIVLGRWKLTETPNAGAGVFSVALARTRDGWRVVHDHTSLDAP